AAFAAIAEVVRLLDADPSTDWSKVNIEALRQHLVDMNEVLMNASVVQRDIPGGMTADVTGSGRTIESIRRVLTNHANMLGQSPTYHAAASEIPGGVRFTVTAKQADDAHTVSRIRGLGFAGLFTEGDHHARHHLALARGDMQAHMR